MNLLYLAAPKGEAEFMTDLLLNTAKLQKTDKTTQ